MRSIIKIRPDIHRAILEMLDHEESIDQFYFFDRLFRYIHNNWKNGPKQAKELQIYHVNKALNELIVNNEVEIINVADLTWDPMCDLRDPCNLDGLNKGEEPCFPMIVKKRI